MYECYSKCTELVYFKETCHFMFVHTHGVNLILSAAKLKFSGEF